MKDDERWRKQVGIDWSLKFHKLTTLSIVAQSLGSMSMRFEIQFITLEVSVSSLASAKYTVSIVANLLQSGSLHASLEWGWVTWFWGMMGSLGNLSFNLPHEIWVVLQQCMQYVDICSWFSILSTFSCVSSSDQRPSAAHHRSSEIKRS